MAGGWTQVKWLEMIHKHKLKLNLHKSADTDKQQEICLEAVGNLLKIFSEWNKGEGIPDTTPATMASSIPTMEPFGDPVSRTDRPKCLEESKGLPEYVAFSCVFVVFLCVLTQLPGPLCNQARLGTYCWRKSSGVPEDPWRGHWLPHLVEVHSQVCKMLHQEPVTKAAGSSKLPGPSLCCVLVAPQMP